MFYHSFLLNVAIIWRFKKCDRPCVFDRIDLCPCLFHSLGQSRCLLCSKSQNFLSWLGYPAPGGQGQINWMQAPPVPENCPPGLEYLTQIDQLLIKQQVELLEGTCLLYMITVSSGYVTFLRFQFLTKNLNLFVSRLYLRPFFWQHSLALKRTISTRF